LGVSPRGWCALGEGGAISGEGVVPADEDGLVKLVLTVGPDVRACVEMMSGAVWVRDRLAAGGWAVVVAHARRVRNIAPLAGMTDRIDARVLAELCRRDLVPVLWLPSLDDRVGCASGCAGGCIWCGCARRRATASWGC
jgi:transposase